MPARPKRSKIVPRVLIGLLLAVLALLVFLSRSPAALAAILQLLPLPGIASLPAFGPDPPPPVISAPLGQPPAGYAAFWGEYSQGGSSGCSFLLQLENGSRVGVSAAHATPPLPAGQSAFFRAADGSTAARLSGQIARGREFVHNEFTLDYVFWGVTSADPAALLQPDPRGQGQPGEAVEVYGPGKSPAGGPLYYSGLLLQASPSAAWIRLDASFDPHGFSGCPVLSAYTGRVIGMAVAGLQRDGSVVMGLHPIASLVEKARVALQPNP
jgi:hypothetical protein